MLNRSRFLLTVAFLGALLAGGCASHPTPGPTQTAALQVQLRQLAPTVNADEARRLAEAALQKSAALAGEYRAVRPAWVHNNFVNYGWRERGLCFHWANDLFAHLHALGLRTLELHLAVARMDTSREHNALVITAPGQPFAEGLVLDAWRDSGRLWSGPAVTDKYPWGPLPEDRVAPELRELEALQTLKR